MANYKQNTSTQSDGRSGLFSGEYSPSPRQNAVNIVYRILQYIVYFHLKYLESSKKKKNLKCSVLFFSVRYSGTFDGKKYPTNRNLTEPCQMGSVQIL